MTWLDRLSIKSKLIVMLLTVSSCSILVTAYLGYQSGQVNLTDRVFSQLTSVRASKAYQIESYFKTIRNHIQTLSESPTTIEAIRDLSRAYSELEETELPTEFEERLTAYYQDLFLPRLSIAEKGSPVLDAFLPQTQVARYLQYHYIAANPNPVGKKHFLDSAKDNSEYSSLHSRYHPIFRNIIEKFGYYDLFLIDPQGTIVYTVYKETDFTSNLTDGAYDESNLARLVAAVRQAKQRDYAEIIDFKAYAPSYGAPAAFIAAPIFDRSDFIGVLAVQLPVNEINNVMTGNRKWQQDGLGKTGETYLVGRDYLMRSVSRFLTEKPTEYRQKLRSLGVDESTLKRIEQYDTSILETRVQTEATQKALMGKQGTQIIRDYRGISVLSSYAPLKIDGLEWAILSEIDLAEAYAPTYSFGRQVLISATLLMLLVTLLAMVMAYLFVKPIERLIASARRVAAGHLEPIAKLETGDEFGELAKSFNAVVRNLRERTESIAAKNRENEELLSSFFPSAIAKRLQRGERNIADNVANIAILSANLTGLSQLSDSLNASELAAILNDLVTGFDETAERYSIEKIKTTGDGYMAVCGLSVPYLDCDKRVVDFALEMLAIVRRYDRGRDWQLNIQIGIHSGDAIAAIVGKRKFTYDIWGKTIEIAECLKSACPQGTILVSEEVYRRLNDIYEFESASIIEGNGKSRLNAWQLKSIQKPIGNDSGKA
jgi:class 3 adenylate cyclase